MSEFRRLMMQSKTESPILNDYLTIVALEDGLTAKLSVNACEYCVDGNGVWMALSAGTETESINKGHTLSFRKTNPTINDSGMGLFTVNNKFNIKGNIMSMVFGDNGKNSYSLSGKNSTFRNLFANNVGLVDASELALPATTLTTGCYREMFSGCTSFTTAPALPAEKLVSTCYALMFYNCTSLVTAPELPATTLANGCYQSMFNGCESLVNAPKLPATTLQSSCYSNMFYGCKSLVTAPELPAEVLKTSCYYYMFSGCSKLNYIKMMATDISATSCMSTWVSGVATSGTFVKNKDATWDVRGIHGVPNNWTIITE